MAPDQRNHHASPDSAAAAAAARQPLLRQHSEHRGDALLRATSSSGCRCNHLQSQIVLCIGSYVLVHALCVILLKFINYRYNFVYPMFMAMVSESTWIVSFPLLYSLASRFNIALRKPTRQRLLVYVVLGGGFAVSKTLASYSETLLPGSVFSIISSSDIVFNLVFSRVVLKRKVTNWHLVSMLLLITGVIPNVVDKVYIAHHHRDATRRAEDVTGLSLTMALALAFVAIAEESFSVVVSDWLLKHNLFGEGSSHLDVERLSQSAWQSNVIFIVEYSSYLSMFAFFGMFIPLFISGEYKLWPSVFHGLFTGEASILNSGTDAVVGVTVSLGLTVASRMYMRFGQYYMVSVRSAFTFAVVKPAPRLLQILVLWAVFGEVMTWPKMVGMLLTTAGFIVYARRTRNDALCMSCECEKQGGPASMDMESRLVSSS